MGGHSRCRPITNEEMRKKLGMQYDGRRTRLQSISNNTLIFLPFFFDQEDSLTWYRFFSFATWFDELCPLSQVSEYRISPIIVLCFFIIIMFFTGLAPWLQVIDEGIEIGFPFHCVCVCKRIQTHAHTLGSLLTQPFQQQRPSVEGQQSSCSQRFLFPLCFYYSFH